MTANALKRESVQFAQTKKVTEGSRESNGIIQEMHALSLFANLTQASLNRTLHVQQNQNADQTR